VKIFVVLQSHRILGLFINNAVRRITVLAHPCNKDMETVIGTQAELPFRNGLWAIFFYNEHFIDKKLLVILLMIDGVLIHNLQTGC
jgi:hypothetical protein